MTGHATRISGYRMKDGRLVRCNKHKDVSARLRERSSKKIAVKRKTAQSPI